MDERVWLHHPGTGGYFHCPVDAVKDHLGMGWQKADSPPEETNPAVAEQLAWRAEQARTEPSSKTPKSARRGETTGDVSNG